MTRDERDALARLGSLLLHATLVLVRTDKPGRASGLLIPWGSSTRVVTARHVIAEGTWAVEATPPSGPTSANDIFRTRIEQRKTLLLRVKADPSSLGATPHDIAWAVFDYDRAQCATDEEAARSTLPLYGGPLDTLPGPEELYTFVAANRDELHKDTRVMVREAAAEAFMTYHREEDDGVRLALGRPHQGDAYYRGSSGAPVADRSGAIIGVVSGGRAEANELVVAGLARFIDVMKFRE